MRARVLIRPKAGILDPQGQAVERALPALGFDGVRNVHVGRLVELDVEDPAQLPAMCEQLLANPLVEDYEMSAAGCSIRTWVRMTHGVTVVKFGVIQFPGSCDERDALHAASRVGDAVLLWHRDHDLQGVDAVIVPGGFSYGDYLRAGALARFSPIMVEVERFARHGGLVLGICNGFQVLCEAGLLPGALLPNTSLRFVCRQVDARRGERADEVDRRVRGGRRPVDPRQAPDRPLLGARPGARRARGERPGRAALRRRPRLQRLGARHRGREQRGGQRRRPHAAPRARRRPADGLGRRAAAVRVGRAGRRR